MSTRASAETTTSLQEWSDPSTLTLPVAWRLSSSSTSSSSLGAYHCGATKLMFPPKLVMGTDCLVSVLEAGLVASMIPSPVQVHLGHNWARPFYRIPWCLAVQYQACNPVNFLGS